MAAPRSSLREELLLEQAKPCKFNQVLETMPDDLRREVVEVLGDPNFSTASVVRALGRRGYKVDRHHINECRRGCECGAFGKETK